MENEELSNCHLPEELCHEVLLRLPIKSVVRFRCVCKSWLSLISDSEFHRAHLQTFKNNRDETHLLVVKRSNLDSVVRCSETYTTSEGTLLTAPPRCRGGDWSVDCLVDGLVLLKGPGRNNLVIWNPSIRKFHDIPSSPANETPRHSWVFDVDVGLGYDPLGKDYKYVNLIFGRNHSLQSAEVYTLGDNSWKIIQYHGNESSNWHWEPFYPSKAIYFRGRFYFICINWDEFVSDLVYFDLRSEAFGSIYLPPLFSEHVAGGKLAVLVGHGTFSLALFDVWEGRISWAVLESSETETESFTWTEPRSLEQDWDLILYFKKNLDMLLLTREVKISEELCCVVSSHNLDSGEKKTLLVEKQENNEVPEVYGYIESLVLL